MTTEEIKQGLGKWASMTGGVERAGQSRPRPIQARCQLLRLQLAERRVIVGRNQCERQGCSGPMNAIRKDDRGQDRGVCSRCAVLLDSKSRGLSAVETQAALEQASITRALVRRIPAEQW
jgi:hypothetical protein